MEFQVGVNVGGYDILDIVSSSKSEIVYRVRNLQAKRIEVMRVLPLSVAGDQEQTERFLREMRVHAKLSHPNILDFYGAAELERRLVMTTEAIDGVTLAERLKLGPLPWKEAVVLMQQALAGLAHAHAQGIVHRDVKPQNMIITPEGVLKLADFGLAKAATSPQVTQVGVVVGTLQYISPEQVRGTAKVDARSDLYSVGLVLYEAVVGKTPFDYKSQFELMVAQVNETPKPPSALNRDVPAQLDAVILEAVAKNPDERFQTADEFSAALERVIALIEEPVQAPAVASVALEPAPAEPKTDAVWAAAIPASEAPPVPPAEFLWGSPTGCDGPSARHADGTPAIAVQAADSAPLDSQPEPPLPASAPPPIISAKRAPVETAAPETAANPALAVYIPAAEAVPAVEVPDVPVPVNGQSALLAAIEASEEPLAAASPARPAEIPEIEVVPPSDIPVAVNGQSALLAAVEASEIAATPALVAEIAAAPVTAAAPVPATAVPVNGQSALLAAVEASEVVFAASTPALVAEIAAAPATAPVSAPSVNGQWASVATALAADAPVAVAIPTAAAETPNVAAAVPAPASVNGQSASIPLALVSDAPVPGIQPFAAEIPVAAAEASAIPLAVNGHSAPAAVALASEAPAPPNPVNGVAAVVASAIAPESVQTATPPPEPAVPAAAAVAVSAPDPPRVQSSTTPQPIEDMAVSTAEEPVSKEDSGRWDAGLLYLFAATVIMLVAAALTALLQTPQ